MRLLRWLPDHAGTALRGGFGCLRKPRKVVQGVVLGPDGVLLALRRELMCWELPGGAPLRSDADEAAALVRELREETGLVIEAGALVWLCVQRTVTEVSDPDSGSGVSLS